MENTETKKPKKKLLPFIVGALILTALIYGIFKYTYSLHHEVTDDAQIEGDINPVLARVSGYVKEIRFEENQLVHKGDTLIVLDDRDLRIKAAQAQASLENAKAGVFVARANVSSAVATFEASKAGIESARVRSNRTNQDFVRYQNLIKDTAVTQQQFENAQAEKESSDAQLTSVTKQQSAAGSMAESAQKQVGVAESVIALRQADLDYANLQLSYSTIIAPVTGYASRKNVQMGQLVNAGSPLFAIVPDSGIYVIANFKETQVGKMEAGDTVEVKVDAFDDQVVNGKVYAFSAATGAKFSLLPPDNATGNFVKVVQRIPVKILITAEKQIMAKLRPGMSVKVAVKID